MAHGQHSEGNGCGTQTLGSSKEREGRGRKGGDSERRKGVVRERRGKEKKRRRVKGFVTHLWS